MLKSLLLFFLNSFKTRAQLKLENIILRKQIEILQRTNSKLQIKRSDRLVFSIMKDLLSNWKDKVFIVKPKTVIKWHRTAFRSYWRSKSIYTTSTSDTLLNKLLLIEKNSPEWELDCYALCAQIQMFFEICWPNCVMEKDRICFIDEGLVVISIKFQLKWSFEYGHVFCSQYDILISA